MKNGHESGGMLLLPAEIIKWTFQHFINGTVHYKLL
jgi:hypothetical protein